MLRKRIRNKSEAQFEKEKIMKRIKKTIVLLMALAVGTVTAACGSGGEKQAAPGTKAETEAASQAGQNAGGEALRKVTFGLQTSTNSLPFYVAKEEGMFQDAGIDAEFLVYTSGGAQMEAAASDAWMFGTGGVLPAYVGMLNMDLRVIGTCMSDDLMVDLFVREDSPIAMAGQGNVPEYPTLYGTADTWKGISVLGPVNTTGHYALGCALEAVGLTLEDINVVNMEVNSANTAFKAGEGDALISWLALSVDAENDGFVKAATCNKVGGDAPSILYATAAACEDPELVETVLDIYYKAARWMTEHEDETVQYYYDHLYNNGVTATMDECRAVIQGIPYHTVEESRAYMVKDANGERRLMKCFEDIMDFLIKQGSYTEEDLKRIKELDLMPEEYIVAIPAE